MNLGVKFQEFYLHPNNDSFCGTMEDAFLSGRYFGVGGALALGPEACSQRISLLKKKLRGPCLLHLCL